MSELLAKANRYRLVFATDYFYDVVQPHYAVLILLILQYQLQEWNDAILILFNELDYYKYREYVALKVGKKKTA